MCYILSNKKVFRKYIIFSLLTKCLCGRMKFASRAVVHSLVRQHRLKMSRCVAAICKSPGGDVVPASCKGVRKGWGLGLTPPLEVGILQKRYYLRKGDELFSHTFCLLICRLNANTTE